jgi:hypothetical protein
VCSETALEGASADVGEPGVPQPRGAAELSPVPVHEQPEEDLLVTDLLVRLGCPDHLHIDFWVP